MSVRQKAIGAVRQSILDWVDVSVPGKAFVARECRLTNLFLDSHPGVRELLEVDLKQAKEDGAIDDFEVWENRQERTTVFSVGKALLPFSLPSPSPIKAEIV